MSRRAILIRFDLQAVLKTLFGPEKNLKKLDPRTKQLRPARRYRLEAFLKPRKHRGTYLFRDGGVNAGKFRVWGKTPVVRGMIPRKHVHVVEAYTARTIAKELEM